MRRSVTRRSGHRWAAMIALVVACALFCALAAGCAGTEKGLRGYLAKRGRDLQDTLRVGVGYGYGLSAHVEATDLANVGAGVAASRKYGLYSKSLHQHSWNEREIAFPVSNALGVYYGASIVWWGYYYGGPKRFMALLLPAVSYSRVVSIEDDTEVAAQFSVIIWTAHGSHVQEALVDPFGANVSLADRSWIEAGATIGIP